MVNVVLGFGRARVVIRVSFRVMVGLLLVLSLGFGKWL
jgi:hypothetical protein